jgi:hypothetical protein
MTPDWSRKFDEPIPLPKERQLVALKDAGTYIAKLPKAEHTAAEWQAAMEALILVATLGGPTMFARIGIMRAFNRHVERVFNPDRKDHHWGRTRGPRGPWDKLERDRAARYFGSVAGSIGGGGMPNSFGSCWFADRSKLRSGSKIAKPLNNLAVSFCKILDLVDTFLGRADRKRPRAGLHGDRYRSLAPVGG